VGEWKPGDRDAARAGRVVGETLQRAVQLAKSGAVQAIVTGPRRSGPFTKRATISPGIPNGWRTWPATSMWP